MKLVILRGEFTIPSPIPLPSPTLLSTNMLSPLNPLTLRSSCPILAWSTKTSLSSLPQNHSINPLNGLLLPLGTLCGSISNPDTQPSTSLGDLKRLPLIPFSLINLLLTQVSPWPRVLLVKLTHVTDVYPLKSPKQFVSTLEDNIRFRGAMTKLISDYAKVEISNKVKDILRMYHSSCWNSEPYHQNQNQAEGRLFHASNILNHLSCEALAGNVPLGMLYGVSQDISIILRHTFYQPLFYATHNQSHSSV